MAMAGLLGTVCKYECYYVKEFAFPDDMFYNCSYSAGLVTTGILLLDIVNPGIRGFCLPVRKKLAVTGRNRTKRDETGRNRLERDGTGSQTGSNRTERAGLEAGNGYSPFSQRLAI
jgi:hypothetical protein